MTIERSGPRALSGSNSDEAATAKIHHEWDRRRVLAVNLHNDAVLGSRLNQAHQMTMAAM